MRQGAQQQIYQTLNVSIAYIPDNTPFFYGLGVKKKCKIE